MIVPLYNSEVAPPEVRGALVALQQLAITFGIMISFWIGYGTNFIGGTGEGQSDAAWLIPVCLQLLPAVVLAAGMLLFMPQSPRHLINRGRDEECLQTLARLRNKSVDDLGVRVEYLEIVALRDFERATAAQKYPQWQDGSFKSKFMIGLNDYKSLLTRTSTPTAVAVSTLDICAPATTGPNQDWYEHWVLTHFLLDGHHKLEAAAASGREVQLLSLVSVDASLARREDVERLAVVRAQPSATRPPRAS